jgi:hypothetical protein
VALSVTSAHRVQPRACLRGRQESAGDSVLAADFSSMYNQYIMLGVTYVIAALFVMRRRVRLGVRKATF